MGTRCSLRTKNQLFIDDISHQTIYNEPGWWNIFFHIQAMVTPTDFHSIIFQRGRAQPPTRNVRGFLPNPRSFFGLSSSSARQRTLGSPTLKAVGFVRRISSEIHARRIHKTQLLERSSSWAGIYKIIIDYIFAH